MDTNNFKSDKLRCAICEKVFTLPGNVKRHVKLVHKITENVESTNIKCTDCPETRYFNSVRALTSHLEKDHGCELQQQVLTFTSMKDFLSWKTEVEKKTRSSYIIRPTRKKNGKLFICHRSGIVKNTGCGIRRLKSQGSCKIGFFCTSRISVTETEENIYVEYIPKHYGHTNDKEHLRLRDDEKAAIASKGKTKVKTGISHDRIIDDSRDDFDGGIKPLDLLTSNIVAIDSNNWMVMSGENTYNVFLYEENKCVDSSCQQNCIHRYGCDCFDHAVHMNMCKHIHAVIKHTAENGNYRNDVNERISELREITSNRNLMDEVVLTTELLLASFKQNREKYDEETARNLLKAINNVKEINFSRKMKKKLTNVPQNKRVKRQQKYVFTVKRKQKKNIHFEKAS